MLRGYISGMTWNWETILWVLLAIDCAGYNGMAWTRGTDWYRGKFKRMSEWLPITRCMGAGYLLLVCWLGCALWRVHSV